VRGFMAASLEPSSNEPPVYSSPTPPKAKEHVPTDSVGESLAQVLVGRHFHVFPPDMSRYRITPPPHYPEKLGEGEKAPRIFAPSDASKHIFLERRVGVEVLLKAQDVVDGLNKKIIGSAPLNEESSRKLEEVFLSTLPSLGSVELENAIIAQVLNEKIGISKFHLRELKGGSGAKIYGVLIPDDKGKLAYVVKIMEGKVSELARELSSLQQLSDLNLHHSTLSTVQTAGKFDFSHSKTVRTIFVQTGAKGQPFSSHLEELGQATSKGRAEKMDVLARGFQQAARGLAELHLKHREKATPLGIDAQIANLEMVKYVYDWVRGAIVNGGERGRIPLTTEELDRIHQAAIKGIEGNWGMSGYSHGDTHLDNLFYEVASGQFSFIDTPSFLASVDAHGAPIGFPAYDFSWAWCSISDNGLRSGLSPTEVEVLQNVFKTGYDQTMGDALPPSTAQHFAALHKQLYYIAKANENQQYLTDNASTIPDAKEKIERLQLVIDREVASIKSNFLSP